MLYQIIDLENLYCVLGVAWWVLRNDILVKLVWPQVQRLHSKHLKFQAPENLPNLSLHPTYVSQVHRTL